MNGERKEGKKKEGREDRKGKKERKKVMEGRKKAKTQEPHSNYNIADVDILWDCTVSTDRHLE